MPGRQHRPAPNGKAPSSQPPADATRIQQPVGSAQRQQQAAPSTTPAPQDGGKPKKEVKGRLRPWTIVRVMLLNLFKALMVLLCIGLVTGSVVAVQLVQYVVDATENDETMLDLENRKINQTTFFMAYNPDNPNAREDNDYIEYQQLSDNENRIWVNYDQIPQYLKDAIVATEDQLFYEHHGVNLKRTVGALVNEVIPLPGMTGGASTITQQLVKNITGDSVVEDEDGGRFSGYQRKLREIFRAWGLENRYSKEMILESYLNTMSLSGRLAGVEAGAQAYFGKTVSELNLQECATIAGITRYPGAYNPFKYPDECLARRDRVLGYMLECGFITQAEHDAAVATPLGLADENAQQTVSSTSTGVFSYAVDKAYDDVLRDLQEVGGYSYAEAEKLLYNGGLRIYMTVDLNVQESLDNIMVNGYNDGSDGGEVGFFMDNDRFPNYVGRMTRTEEDGTTVLPQAAVAVINYDGELIATSGGIGQKEGSLSLNRSIGTLQDDGTVKGTLRQVGSVMKPIAAYALGIDYGIITYSKTVRDDYVLAKDPNRRNDPNATKDWPSNYGNKLTRQKVTIAGAIAESYNTVAAQVGLWVGRDAMFEFLRDTLEVSSLVYPDDADLGPLVLGSQTYGMSAYELAGAYQIFGGNDTYGTFNTLHSYTRVTDAKGNTVLEPQLTTVQAIDPQSGFVMNRLLKGPLSTQRVGGASPTAGGMAPEGEMDAVGKTGTTSDDYDRWFVGLTPYYVTAVWWGYDHAYGEGGHSLESWSPSARINIPVNVWKALMEDVQADLEYKDFPAMPEGVFEAKGCRTSGDLAGPGCPTIDSYYTSFATPQVCAGHPTEDAEAAAAEAAAAAAAAAG